MKIVDQVGHNLNITLTDKDTMGLLLEPINRSSYPFPTVAVTAICDASMSSKCQAND